MAACLLQENKPVAACLLQENKPVAFASKTLTLTQSAYSNIEREAVAIKNSIRISSENCSLS